MNIKTLFSQPLIGSRASNVFHLLKKNKPGRRWRFVIRLGYVFLSSHLLMSLLGRLENWRYRKMTGKANQIKDPVFIIGHWRSGTTFLHYLMTKDNQFGYVNNCQAFMPHLMFSFQRTVRWLTRTHLLKKRPMDDVKLYWNSPQEEEFALANLSVSSAYHGWYFPQRLTDYFEKYALMQGLTAKERWNFKLLYRRYIQKACIANRGKLLLLKNPANTGRVRMLLELFPNARFIYLRREPWQVYLSSLRLHEKMIASFGLQNYEQKKLPVFVSDLYRKLIDKYETDKALIPNEKLIEVDYEQLVQEPLSILQMIYGRLNLPGYERAKAGFVDYLQSQAGYKAASYSISPAQKQQINNLLLKSFPLFKTSEL